MALILFKYIKIKNYAIKLINEQQLSYRPIYNLKPIELKTLKTYININLVNNFIKPFKSQIKVPIFFDKKPNKNLLLYIDYQKLNNLI